jgi:hypothetical protein
MESIIKIKEEDFLKCSKILERVYSCFPDNENFKKNTAKLYILNKYNN